MKPKTLACLFLLMFSVVLPMAAQTTYTVPLRLPAGCTHLENCILFVDNNGWNGEGGELWFHEQTTGANFLVFNNGANNGQNYLNCTQGVANCKSFQYVIANQGVVPCGDLETPALEATKPCVQFEVSASGTGTSQYDLSPYTLGEDNVFIRFWALGRLPGYRYSLSSGRMSLTASSGTLTWLGVQ